MWQQIYFWAKKIHNWVMWLVVVLGGWMMASGWIMHRELGGEWVPPMDTEWIRYYHNAVSQWFVVVLLLQMVTGLLMWGVPKLLQKIRQG